MTDNNKNNHEDNQKLSAVDAAFAKSEQGQVKDHPGFLISFEGGEGGGKTTHSVRLRDRLTQAGHDVVVLREPGGTVISEQIREVILSPQNTSMAFTTEVFLFQAARAQIYREIVLPSLQAGKIVLMDRSRDSSLAYQGMVRGFGHDLIEQLNNLSTKNTYPDLTFLLDVPVEVGLRRRLATEKQDRLDMEAKQFHQQVREAYLQLAQADQSLAQQRWHIINAKQEIEAIEQEIWQVVQAKLSAKQADEAES